MLIDCRKTPLAATSLTKQNLATPIHPSLSCLSLGTYLLPRNTETEYRARAELTHTGFKPRCNPPSAIVSSSYDLDLGISTFRALDR